MRSYYFDKCYGTRIDVGYMGRSDKEGVIIWHPFPETKPAMSGDYLVADKFGRVSQKRFYNASRIGDNYGKRSVRRNTNISWWAELPDSPDANKKT